MFDPARDRYVKSEAERRRFSVSYLLNRKGRNMEKPKKGKTSTVEVEMVKLKFPKVNVMAFSFWVMQYMDCVEVLEGELLKKILKERMKWALENRIK